MEERILKFIQRHHLLTLATSDSQAPYCCNVFYAFDLGQSNFYFMSSPETKHIQDAMKQPLVAGTIVADDNIARLRGIQFTGRFLQLRDTEFELAKRIYLKKFPVA